MKDLVRGFLEIDKTDEGLNTLAERVNRIDSETDKVVLALNEKVKHLQERTNFLYHEIAALTQRLDEAFLRKKEVKVHEIPIRNTRKRKN